MPKKKEHAAENQKSSTKENTETIQTDISADKKNADEKSGSNKKEHKNSNTKAKVAGVAAAGAATASSKAQESAKGIGATLKDAAFRAKKRLGKKMKKIGEKRSEDTHSSSDKNIEKENSGTKEADSDSEKKQQNKNII